jgi:hypothetical protein
MKKMPTSLKAMMEKTPSKTSPPQIPPKKKK